MKKYEDLSKLIVKLAGRFFITTVNMLFCMVKARNLTQFPKYIQTDRP